MSDHLSPQQLLARILYVAQLLTYTQPSDQTEEHCPDDYAASTDNSIIGSNDNSGELVEKLRSQEKM